MSLKKTTNRKIKKEENDVLKSWCHDFGNEGGEYSESILSNVRSKKDDPIYSTLIPLRETDLKIHNADVCEYSEVELALEKADKINPIDRPRFIFNIAKGMKTASPLDNLNTFLNRSLDLDYITKSQKEEIIKIIE